MVLKQMEIKLKLFKKKTEQTAWYYDACVFMTPLP